MGQPRVDLFVMSHCPFSRRAEASIAADLKRLGDKAPVVAVHYVLHWVAEGLNGRRLGSTHGESELAEDAVQILIRDMYPARFWKYVALRAGSDATWETLALEAGMSVPDVGAVDRRLREDQDQLLTTELETNTHDFPFIPETPTVYWQGSLVDAIGMVPGFSTPASTNEKCPAEESETR